ncbi:MAG: radical SAM protein [Candidatus Altiarchaeota archaeon]
MTSRIIHGREDVDVVLVNPPYERHLVRGNVHYTASPLGLAYLSAVLKGEGFSVRGYDFCTGFTSMYDALQEISKHNPRVVGVSLNSMGLRFAHIFFKSIRERMPDVITIAGGPHVTVDPEVIFDLGVDYGLRGESEEDLVKLCGNVLRGEAFGERGGVFSGKDREDVGCPSIIRNIDDIPFPDRGLFDDSAYKFQSMVLSRGCPFQCSYCGMAGTEFRQRGLDNVMDEMKTLASKGFASVEFADDVFTLDKDYVIRLCERMMEGKLGFTWSCTTRTDLVDEELLKAMRDAGCRYISFGVESGVEHIRYSLGKKIPNETYSDIFSECRRIGIKTRAYGMLGHPGETLKDMEDTIAFINSLNPNNVLYTPTIIFPGTRLMEYCVRNNIIEPDAWRQYMNGLRTRPIFIPEGISPETLEKTIWRAYNSFYLRPQFIKERLIEARSISDVVRAGVLTTALIGERVYKTGDRSRYVR